MLLIDRSRGILTGMICAALYVILLLGFGQETYVLRAPEPDAAGASYNVASSESRPVALGERAKPEPFCLVEHQVCGALYAEAGDQQMCQKSMRKVIQVMTLRSDGLRLEHFDRSLREVR